MVAEEALEIYKATDTDFWRKAVNKEMAKVKIAWKTNDGLIPQQARGLHKKGSLSCCWRSHDHGTELDDLFKKRCVTRQHTPRIPNCGVE
jgi:hypothetical protein